MYKTSYYNFIIPVPEYKVYLLYNSLNNFLYEVDQVTGKIFNEIENQEISSSVLNKLKAEDKEVLIKERFIVGREVDETAILHKLILKNQEKFQKKDLFSLTILPTNSCNMRCPYCFEGSAKPKYGKMPEIIQEAIASFVEKEVNDDPVKFKRIGVSWFGGEPLLALDEIQTLSMKLIKIAKKYNIEYKSNI